MESAPANASGHLLAIHERQPDRFRRVAAVVETEVRSGWEQASEACPDCDEQVVPTLSCIAPRSELFAAVVRAEQSV
jgi:hypothetical protein